MQVTNLAGGGGGVAFAEVVNKRNKDDNLIVAASSATATRLAQGAYPGNNMDQVRWLGAIGADYGVIAVAKNSPIETLPEIMAKIKADPRSVAFAGGSAVGGWDHLKVLIVAKKAGISDVRSINMWPSTAAARPSRSFSPARSGLHRRCLGGQGLCRFRRHQGLGGAGAGTAGRRLCQFPTAKEQGIDAVGANWRGFYAPGGMSDDAYTFWVDAIGKVYASPEWKKVMAQNGLAPLEPAGRSIRKIRPRARSATSPTSPRRSA